MIRFLLEYYTFKQFDLQKHSNTRHNKMNSTSQKGCD